MLVSRGTGQFSPSFPRDRRHCRLRPRSWRPRRRPRRGLARRRHRSEQQQRGRRKSKPARKPSPAGRAAAARGGYAPKKKAPTKAAKQASKKEVLQRPERRPSNVRYRRRPFPPGSRKVFRRQGTHLRGRHRGLVHHRRKRRACIDPGPRCGRCGVDSNGRWGSRGRSLDEPLRDRGRGEGCTESLVSARPPPARRAFPTKPAYSSAFRIRSQTLGPRFGSESAILRGLSPCSSGPLLRRLDRACRAFEEKVAQMRELSRQGHAQRVFEGRHFTSTVFARLLAADGHADGARLLANRAISLAGGAHLLAAAAERLLSTLK